MSRDTVSVDEVSSEPVDGLDAADAVATAAIFSQIYAFFYNKVVGLVLILLTGLLSFFGVLFPQMPSGVRDDPQAQTTWLNSVRETFGGWTDILHTIGFFKMFSSIPFLIVMAMLALSIIACTVHRLPVLWQAAKHPHTRVTAAFYDRARLRSTFTTPASTQTAFDTICNDARAHRMRVIVDERGPGLNAYLDRNHWAPFGTALAHAAFVIIMAGFVVSATTGFRTEQFPLTVGMPREVGFDTGLVAEAKSFQDSYYPDGTPKDYVADLVLYDDGQQVAAQEIRVNSPLSYHGVMFHQAYFGVSAVVKITDAAGTEQFHNGIAQEWNTADGRLTYGHITLGDHIIYAISSASGQSATGIEPGQLQIEVYDAETNEPIAQDVIDMGEATDVGGYVVTFEREQQFTGLIIKKDPGTPIVWFGFALLIIGTCMTMLFRHHRVWLRVTETDDGTRVQIGSPDQQDSGFTRFFTDLVIRSAETMANRDERNANA